MNPSTLSDAQPCFEVPYGPKAWKMATVAIFISASELVIVLVVTHDQSASFAIRSVLWCIVIFGAYPLAAALATLVVTCAVHRTLKLTTFEISAPRAGYSLQNTTVPLREIKKVTVRLTPDGRYVDIYHSTGRLGVAESWLPNSEAFEKVLGAVSGQTERQQLV